jgi:hypothetical protein
LNLQTTTPQPSASAASAASGDLTAALRDPQFLDELLDSLPGVDKSEIDIDVRFVVCFRFVLISLCV